MNKFEKKFGKYAIHNLSLVLILCYVAGYVINLINGAFLSYLTLNPYEILFHGQIWRLVTWIVVPPSTLLLNPMDIFFTAIMLLFYYNIGTTLERTWGTYRYNVFILMGMVFTIIGSFFCLGLHYLTGGGTPAETAFVFALGAQMFSTYYINMSIFLAFAMTFPNVQVYLMFVIPVKVKWMGIFYIVMMAWEFIVTGGPFGTFVRVAIGASLLNVAVFFFCSRNRMHLSPRQIKRRTEFKQKVRQSERQSGHRCAICGRTDADDPSLEFRYCSKCEGNYEYCQYHLFTHEHVRK